MILLREAIETVIRLTQEEWADLSGRFSASALEKGDFFSIEGRVETEIGFLTDGVVRAFYRITNGIEYNKTLFVKGDFFGGYASLVSGKPNRINIQALTNVTFYKSNYQDISDLFKKYRNIETLCRLIAERFYIEKENREIELVLLQADERYKIFKEQFPGIENEIPQYHIASYLGITPTQLSRIRAKR